MWWARSKRVEVYFAQTLVGWRVAGEGQTRWETTTGVEAGLAALARWCADEAAPKRARLRVWLGSSLARPWMLFPDAGVRSSAEARALAASMARDMTGWGEMPRTWTAPWRVGQPTPCVAIPQRVHAALVGTEAALGTTARVEAVRPWWNSALNEMLALSGVTAGDVGWSLAEPDGLVCGLARAGWATELRFEGRKSHDPDWALLRRRLAVSWADARSFEHRDFALEGGEYIGGVCAVAERPEKA